MPPRVRLVQAEVADGSVTASKMAEGAVSKSALDATILKYLKPEITSQPQDLQFILEVMVLYHFQAEGKYLTYQWKKDGVDLAVRPMLLLTSPMQMLHSMMVIIQLL